jgi:hypothetical protein
MAVYSRTYYGIPGQTSIIDPTLAFVNILKVARNDSVHRKVDSAPGNLQFKHNVSTGQVDFDANNPFTGSSIGRPNRFEMEKIFVKWRV